MDTWAKSFLLHAYFAGMSFFIMAWIFGQGFVGIGIMTGVFSGLIVEPLLQRSEKIGPEQIAKIFSRFKIVRCILFSVLICYLIAVSRFRLVPAFDFEPFSFGLIYALAHVPIFALISKIWGLVWKARS